MDYSKSISNVWALLQAPKDFFEDEQHKDMKLKVKVAYALLKTRLELWEDNPYFTNCLKDFFGNTGVSSSYF